jgi:glyoxylase-like metal-dependent hydrolase (beta-lactamase superfamily II)
MLEIATFTLGPVDTNTYLIANSDTREAAVIDPAWDGQLIVAEAKRCNWQISQVWITHAHFDHIGGAGDLARILETPPIIGLHPDDRLLWDNQGGAGLFGFTLPASPTPKLNLTHKMELGLGGLTFKVLHTPGHTPGHCAFYCAEATVCFCGDLIFQNSVGRTDLPGGDWDVLVKSIRLQIYSLPDETRLLSGHGPETTVGQEKSGNPFVHA